MKKSYSVKFEELGPVLHGIPKTHWAVDAALLQRICFWHQNAKPKVIGRVKPIGYWCVMTIEEWARDTHVLTYKQARASLDRLADHRVIQVARHNFQGRTRLFLRLTPEAARLLGLGGPGVKVAKPNDPRAPEVDHWTGEATAPQGSDAALFGTVSAPQGSYGAPQGEPIQAASGSSQAATGISGEDAAGTSPGDLESDPEQEKNMTTAAEVKQSLEAEKKELRKPETLARLIQEATEDARPGALEKVMRCAWIQARRDTPRPLTIKEKGQLRELHVFLTDSGLVSATVLAAVVMRWGQFTEAVKEEAGHWRAPSRPQMAYILKWRDTLADWVGTQGEGASVPTRREWKHVIKYQEGET